MALKKLLWVSYCIWAKTLNGGHHPSRPSIWYSTTILWNQSLLSWPIKSIISSPNTSQCFYKTSLETYKYLPPPFFFISFSHIVSNIISSNKAQAGMNYWLQDTHYWYNVIGLLSERWVVWIIYTPDKHKLLHNS